MSTHVDRPEEILEHAADIVRRNAGKPQPKRAPLAWRKLQSMEERFDKVYAGTKMCANCGCAEGFHVMCNGERTRCPQHEHCDHFKESK